MFLMFLIKDELGSFCISFYSMKLVQLHSNLLRLNRGLRKEEKTRYCQQMNKGQVSACTTLLYVYKCRDKQYNNFSVGLI